MKSTLVVGLRIVAGLTVVVVMIAAGWWHRSPWIVGLATPAFTVLYALGKWDAWKAAWRAGGARQIILAVLATVPIQAIFAGVLYCLGVGLGRLVTGYRPIAALSAVDVIGTGVLLAVGIALGAAIIRLEGATVAAPVALTPEIEVSQELELDVDPTPLTLDTFFTSPGYWRVNAAWQALEGRGATTIEKPPLAAREDMIVATEERLQVRLPETLRNLYSVMNGGYVDWLFVQLKAEPEPVFADWRGAFSIDYSSLAPLERLRTVAEHYDDFTDDPDDLPANADQLIVLQARYGDMTLLDYSRGAEPRVLLVDYDTYGDDPVDLAFDDFDLFFAALRRDRSRTHPDPPPRRTLDVPLGQAPEDTRARRFWGDAAQHPFATNAAQRADGSEPKSAADDGLVAETQARLGLTLPASLIALWRAKNGGGVASRFVEVTAAGVIEELEVMRRPVPLEYVVTLADLSDRVTFPSGELPWGQRHVGADRLVVLEADHDRAVLLDYRDRPDHDPAVLVVDDLSRPLVDATRFEHWDELLMRLRFQRSAWDDVAKPHDADL